MTSEVVPVVHEDSTFNLEVGSKLGRHSCWLLEEGFEVWLYCIRIPTPTPLSNHQSKQEKKLFKPKNLFYLITVVAEPACMHLDYFHKYTSPLTGNRYQATKVRPDIVYAGSHGAQSTSLITRPHP